MKFVWHDPQTWSMKHQVIFVVGLIVLTVLIETGAILAVYWETHR